MKLPLTTLLSAALVACALATPAAAHEDKPKYVTKSYHHPVHEYRHHPRHWNRYDRRYARQLLREQRRYREAWARELAWHDRRWGRQCEYRHRRHDHVDIGGRIVIRF